MGHMLLGEAHLRNIVGNLSFCLLQSLWKMVWCQGQRVNNNQSEGDFCQCLREGLQGIGWRRKEVVNDVFVEVH